VTGPRVAWLLVRSAVGIALLVWLSRSGVIDWARVAAIGSRPGLLALVVGLLVAGLIATAWRLCVLGEPLGIRIGMGASMRLLLIGTCFNVFMPGSAGGDLARLYLALRGQQGRRAELAAVLVFDRVIGLVALLLVPLALALAFPAAARLHPTIVTILWWAVGLAAATAVVAVALWGPVGREWLRRLLARLPLGDLLTRAGVALRVYRSHPGALVAALVLSLVATTLGLVIMLLLARAMGATGSPQVMLVLLPIGSLINAIPLTPGGLGVGEVAMDRLFQLAGLTGGAAAIVGWRLLLLLPAAVGLVLYVQGRGDFVANASAPKESESAA
jgi:uncharacterized membrane protein YbhN (UPF0104 family)